MHKTNPSLTMTIENYINQIHKYMQNDIGKKSMKQSGCSRIQQALPGSNRFFPERTISLENIAMFLNLFINELSDWDSIVYLSEFRTLHFIFKAGLEIPMLKSTELADALIIYVRRRYTLNARLNRKLFISWNRKQGLLDKELIYFKSYPTNKPQPCCYFNSNHWKHIHLNFLLHRHTNRV